MVKRWLCEIRSMAGKDDFAAALLLFNTSNILGRGSGVPPAKQKKVIVALKKGEKGYVFATLQLF